MQERRTFCEECRKDVIYRVEEILLTNELKGEAYEFIGKKAICIKCGAEVYIAEIEDYNLNALYDAYREKNNIISTDKIIEISQKYNIGKRPISLLLGWGEVTFSRYCEGYIPTKHYAETLQKLYDDPHYYLELLEANKEKLPSQRTYEKSKQTTEKLLGVTKEPLSKIDIVSDYMLCKCGDVTPLTLQKALYYVQGFFFAFKGEFLFEDDCQAWVHGPAYPKIYERYRSNGYEPIDGDDVCDESELTTFEKAIVDSVIRNFCCYSGKVLESFTHSEEPWLKSRGDLPAAVASNEPISKVLIGKYFLDVKKRYSMLNPTDIEVYSKDLFNRLN
jgi:uncharacterized phage-associated protein